jgi:hypothetical protein
MYYRIPEYACDVWLYVGDFATCVEWLKSTFDCSIVYPVAADTDGLSWYVTASDTVVGYFMWLPTFNNDTEALVTLSHECLHTAVNILYNAQVPAVEGVECETLNYLHNKIYRKFLQELTELEVSYVCTEE